ncbi:MAG: transcriptional regulator TbsP [Halobacteriota archaeon]
MTESSNLLAGDVEDILSSVLESTTDELLIVNPTAEAVESLINVATSFEGELPEIRLLAEESILKEVMNDFIVASNAADLIAGDNLAMRTTTDETQNVLLITPASVRALVSAGDRVAALATEDVEFVDVARDTYTEYWSEADEFKLRTPPISQVRETLAAEIGDGTQSDFDSVLSSLKTARGDGDGLDEVTISLLVAAKNDVLLYDISKWGEDVGIASKATFSRTKTKLEDMGLIDTEKVPIDVGRPRLRLKLGDDRLRAASADQIAGVAQSLLT